MYNILQTTTHFAKCLSESAIQLATQPPIWCHTARHFFQLKMIHVIFFMIVATGAPVDLLI